MSEEFLDPRSLFFRQPGFTLCAHRCVDCCSAKFSRTQSQQRITNRKGTLVFSRRLVRTPPPPVRRHHQIPRSQPPQLWNYLVQYPLQVPQLSRTHRGEIGQSQLLQAMPQRITYPLPHAPKNSSASLTSWGCVRWNVATSSSAERSCSSASFRLTELNHRIPPTPSTVAATTRSPVNCGGALRYAPSPASAFPNDSDDASWMRFSQCRFKNRNRTSSVTTACRAGGGSSRAGG
jgi:hypothetical protein